MFSYDDDDDEDDDIWIYFVTNMYESILIFYTYIYVYI